jgi:hypothetical protein
MNVEPLQWGRDRLIAEMKEDGTLIQRWPGFNGAAIA